MLVESVMSLPHDGVYAIDPLRDPRWPAFVERHPNASVFHARGWLQALRDTYGYDPVAFTTSAPLDDLKNALVFCIVRSWLTGKRIVSLPFSDHCEPLVEHPEQFRILCGFVARIRNERKWKYVEMRYGDPSLNCDGNFGKSMTYCLHQLDLRPSLDVLYSGFHKDCIQRKIIRADREALTYEEGRSELLLQQLYGLLKLTRSRHHLPPQPIEWFRNVVSCMGKDACIRIVSKAGQPVAGILTLNHANKMVYKYGGSDSRFNSLGGTAKLFWQAIKDAKQAGVEVLDFGRSDLDNPGLITFKRRWSAECSLLNTWREPMGVSSPYRERLKVRCTQEIFARLPDSVLTLAGRFLYRHIG